MLAEFEIFIVAIFYAIICILRKLNISDIASIYREGAASVYLKRLFGVPAACTYYGSIALAWMDLELFFPWLEYMATPSSPATSTPFLIISPAPLSPLLISHSPSPPPAVPLLPPLPCPQTTTPSPFDYHHDNDDVYHTLIQSNALTQHFLIMLSMCSWQYWAYDLTKLTFVLLSFLQSCVNQLFFEKQISFVRFMKTISNYNFHFKQLNSC
ncbi:hypothetical protein LIER_10136 [Lithospermum erythrorhizon]|uniref:Uncharacterized protein n=1 Tax=Lithospermum erythrorhizon TaxID=34254 RepID=A0AAV3PJG6_LITER